EQLIKLLSDSEPAVRGEAARLIGKYGFVEALPALKATLDFENNGRWSEVEMQLIETKTKQTYTAGGKRTGGQPYNRIIYYDCVYCHGNMEFNPDEICAEARLKPWNYTRNIMKKAVEALQ
ncbi:MAG: HEAT repeat domain-containing protein, partial [Candidatus Eremiobacterota bacterium]